MASPNAYSEDELDRLVRGALNDRVRTQEPPEHAWKRIRLELEKADPPRRFQIRWSPVVVQAALTLLLVLVGSVGLHVRLGQSGMRLAPRDLPTSVPTAYVDQRLVSPSETLPSNETDVGSLKNFSKLWSAPEIDTEPERYPSGIVPLDVERQPMRMEGGLPDSEPSSVFLLVEQNGLGPYER